MESKQIISFQESKNIIECFFKVDFDYDELLKKHRSKHKPTQIIDHVKGIFRKLILDIEYELMISDKIKTMQLYQNNSKEMFDELMNLKQIIPVDARSDFNIYYRNRVSRISVYQTDLISSDRRLFIYNVFLNYAIDHDLFKFSYLDGETSIKKQLTQRPSNIYAMNALETIFRYYESQNGDIRSIQRKLKRDGMYVAPMYQGALLRSNLKNLFLIGLYRVYQSAMRTGMRPAHPWKIFCQKYQTIIDSFQPFWLKTLLRICVQNNVKPEQQIQISKMIKKRFYTGDISARISESSRGKKQAIFKKIKGEMKKIIKGEEKVVQQIDVYVSHKDP